MLTFHPKRYNQLSEGIDFLLFEMGAERYAGSVHFLRENGLDKIKNVGVQYP